MSDMVKTGDRAPEFKLSNKEGKTVSLKDHRGNWVVLYFYPKNHVQEVKDTLAELN